MDIDKIINGDSESQEYDGIAIRDVYKNRAISFIHQYHYSKILPRITKRYVGFYKSNKLIGVITLGWGTQPLQTITHVFYNHDFTTSDYLEIGKMCFHPDYNNSNYGSKMMAILIKWLKVNSNISFLYTLADGIQGKCGYVYQASNFQYIGKFKTSVYMDRKTSEKIHPRSAKQLLIENAKFEGVAKVHWLTHRFCEHKNLSKINGLMFRYMYPLNKKSRKVLKSYKEYSGLINPKDKNLKFWERIGDGEFKDIPMPNFNMGVFEHNFQKY